MRRAAMQQAQEEMQQEQIRQQQRLQQQQQQQAYERARQEEEARYYQQQQQAARPHVAVDNHAFVHDMLVSLDDSLEENGFRAAMAAFAHDAAAAASSGAGMRGTATGASAPLMSPLNDTPTLLQGALSPSSWAAPAGEERDTGAALSTGLGAIPSLGSVSNLLADMGTAAGFAFMD